MTANRTAPIEAIRKVASAIAFDELTSPAPVSTDHLIRSEKLAAVEDEELFKIAANLSAATLLGEVLLVDRISDVLNHYEDLGGKYKEAFGAPMFNPQQMTGSPALAGGMQRRATTMMPSPQQAQPTKSPATSSPRAQVQGGATQSAALAPATPSTAPTSAAPAPTVSVSMGG